MAELDVILTYFNTDLLIKKCLENILKTEGVDFNVYVVDNTLKSGNFLSSLFNDKRVNIIRGVDGRKKFKTSARGRHHPDGIGLGIKNSSSKYIALFHSDSWPIDPLWYAKCKGYIDKGSELVWIQHESSIHHSFHFVKRKTLSDLDFNYSIKQRFGKDFDKYVIHSDFVRERRHKWDYGEKLAIDLYKQGKTTTGLLPYAACYPKDIACEHKTWRKLKEKGYGTIYANTIFHFWKSFRRCDQVENVLEFFNSDRYLTEHVKVNKNNMFCQNKSIHDNTVYYEEEE